MNINKFLLLNVLCLMFFPRFASAEDLKDYYLSVTSKNVYLDVNINGFPAVKEEGEVGGGFYPVSYNIKNGVNEFEVNYVLFREKEYLIKIDLLVVEGSKERRVVIFNREGGFEDKNILTSPRDVEVFSVQSVSDSVESRYVSSEGDIYSSESVDVAVSLEGSALNKMPWDDVDEVKLELVEKEDVYSKYKELHGYIYNSDFNSVKLESQDVWAMIASSFGDDLDGYLEKANPMEDIKPFIGSKVLQPLKSIEEYTVEVVGDKIIRLRPNPIIWKKENSSKKITISYVFYYDQYGQLKLAGMPPN